MCVVSRLLHKSFSEIEESMSLAEFYTHLVYERHNPLVDKLIASYVGFYKVESERKEKELDKQLSKEMEINSLQNLFKEQKEKQIFKKKDKNNEEFRI